VLEVIKLVKDQITASNVPIRAVLLVGGFGASNYLKERLRNAIDSKVQIMQPPNAWQAVVQGAVMKGLAISAPEKLTVVKVQNRKARKHYGTEWRTRYDDKLHSHLRDKRHWCGLDGCYKVYTMEWFIQRVGLTFLPWASLFHLSETANKNRVNPSLRTSPSSPRLSGPA
jgi:ribulose kinase